MNKNEKYIFEWAQKERKILQDILVDIVNCNTPAPKKYRNMTLVELRNYFDFLGFIDQKNFRAAATSHYGMDYWWGRMPSKVYNYLYVTYIETTVLDR